MKDMQRAFGLGILTLLLTISACEPMPVLCGRGNKLGHPTMTVEELTFGSDGRVRSLSEGATGGVGGSTPTTTK
jgi:hypothetical protein